MIVVEGGRWIWKDQLVFFPNQDELLDLVQGLASNALVRVRQTTVELKSHPHLVQRSLFRTSHIDLRKDSESIYQEMDSKSCRYEIRKVEKVSDRLQIHFNDVRVFEDFLELHNDFVRLKGHTGPLAERRLQQYLPVSDVWVVYFDGRPVAGHLLIHDHCVKRVRLIFSATVRLQSPEAAKLSGPLNRYLHWHELKFYKSKAIEIYDFGGIGDGSSSVAKFKLSFGGGRVAENSYVFAGTLGNIGYKCYEGMTRLKKHLRFKSSSPSPRGLT